MREQAQSLLTRTPRTVLAFAAFCLLLDVAGLIVQRTRVSAHPLVAAVELALALVLLAALVIWQRRWAWWLCVITAAAWLVSPAWGDRVHPLDDLLEAALLTLLLTSSMRRHVGGAFGWRRPGPNSRWWSLKAWVISLAFGAAFASIGFVGGPHRAIQSTSRRDIDLVLFGLALAVALRLVGFLAQLARRSIRRRDAPAT